MFILLIVFQVALLLVIFLRYFGKRTSKFPPGPTRLPLVGNLLQMGVDLKAVFKTWHERYGDLVGFYLGSQPCVVISDFDVLNRVFKDDRFSGRPAHLQEIFSAFFNEGSEKSNGGIVFNHGSAWKEQRKFAMKTLKDFGVGKTTIENVINEEVRKLVNELLEEVEKPVNMRLRTNMAVVNTIWQILNGEKSDMKNPKMKKVFKSTTEFIASTSLSGPLMIMPWLRYLPVFNTQFERIRRSPQEMRELTSESIRQHAETYQEDHQRDFIDCYIKKIQETEDEHSSFYERNGKINLQRTIMDLFGAGSDTTSSLLCFSFNYLIRFPEIQNRLHEEISSVIGIRDPQLSDRVNMPYLDAFIHEVLRHASIVYTTPHATTEDVELDGYILPKGTAVYANMWWIMNDPKHWDQPEKFNPERFLTSTGEFQKNDRCIPFLIGKRFCIGQTLAQQELFLFLTGILQRLSFRTVLSSSDLVNIEPEVKFLHTCPEYEVIISERL